MRARRGLEDDTDQENDAARDDGGPATEEVGKITCNQGPKESAGREV